jgi:superfamily I DNA/RNA helicase
MNSEKNEIAQRLIEELDHFGRNFKPTGGHKIINSQYALELEPFVGYVKLKNDDGQIDEFLICRNYTPHCFQPFGKNALFGSYLSDNVGALMVRNPGAPYEYDPDYKMVQKCNFEPEKDIDKWDATKCKMFWVGGLATVDSARFFLEQLEPSTSKLDQATQIPSSHGAPAISVSLEPPAKASKISPRVQLPARATLDLTQDEIFRLPFNKKIRISGAPGTGKTTVLLKRLSQKTKREFLKEEELKLIGNTTWEKDNDNWVLFTPSDLLKGYLKDALAKEMLPATDKHVQVFETFRLEMLREAGFIRIGQKGIFTILDEKETLLKEVGYKNVIALNEEFEAFLNVFFQDYLHKKTNRFNQQVEVLKPILDSERDSIARKARELQRESEAPDAYQGREKARRLRELFLEISRFSQAYQSLIDPLKSIQSIDLRFAYQLGSRIQEGAAQLMAKPIGLASFPQISPIITKLIKELRDFAESLSLKNLYELIGKGYQNFRENPGTFEKYFQFNKRNEVESAKISAEEQSVLLYQAVEFVRKFTDLLPADGNGVPDGIQQILARMKPIITIDEVADFSPLEIACMERFALPRIGGVSICGDLMQRVTKDGLQSWEDLAEMSGTYDSYELILSYRQTATLFEIANKLHGQMTQKESNYRSANAPSSDDPLPLSKKCPSISDAAEWITGLIEEILSSNGGRLPGMAVLVPDKESVEYFKVEISKRLTPIGVKVDGSQEGNSLGSESKVRIFPVENIKGLEFEVVFYVSIDRMAALHGDLIDKFLYVGLSRARRFLALAYEVDFPKELACIEQMLKSGDSFFMK